MEIYELRQIKYTSNVGTVIRLNWKFEYSLYSKLIIGISTFSQWIPTSDTRTRRAPYLHGKDVERSLAPAPLPDGARKTKKRIALALDTDITKTPCTCIRNEARHAYGGFHSRFGWRNKALVVRKTEHVFFKLLSRELCSERRF